MEFLTFALKGNYKRFYNNLKEVSKKNGKSPVLMFIDAAISSVLVGSGLTDYLNYKFYDRTYKERREYVTIKYGSEFYAKYSPKDLATNLRIKTNFHKYYSKYTKREYYIPEFGLEKLKDFLSRNEVFMIKPTDGLAGTDVKKMSIKDVETTEKFYEYLKEKNMFLEEFIIQDAEWGKICPNSVNTIRAMTRIINGKAELFYAAARIGNGTAVVDNFHQGGVGVRIDMDKGTLIGNAVSKDLEEVECHPASGVKFDGFKIPYWNEIKQMVCEAAMVNPDVKVVGWDVAISNKGPLLIEANRRPGFDLVQVLENKGTKYMLEEVKKDNSNKKEA